jgi:Tol biopolymer transport system component
MTPNPRQRLPLLLLVATAVLFALAGTAGGSSGPLTAAFGRIAVEGDGDVVVVGAKSGHKHEVAVFVQSAPAWSPDGREVAYAANGAIRATRVESRKERMIVRIGRAFSVGPSWSPDGRRLAFAIHGAYGGAAWLVVVGRDGRKRHTLDASAGSYQVPQWSPDGRRIAYLRDSGDFSAVWIVRPDGGGRRLLRRGVFDYPDSLSWSPDGDRIAFVGLAGGNDTRAALVVARANGTQPRVVADAGGEPDQATVGSVRWSPAGGRIAFLRWGQDAETEDALCVVDPQGRRERLLVRAPYIDDVTWSPDGRWLAYLSENPGRPSGLPFSIWIMRADGSGKRRLARLNERSEALAWGRPTPR